MSGQENEAGEQKNEAVLAAIREAEAEAERIKEGAKRAAENAVAKARAQAAAWEQRELEQARAELQGLVEAENGKKVERRGAAEAEKLRKVGEKKVGAAVELVAEDFEKLIAGQKPLAENRGMERKGAGSMSASSRRNPVPESAKARG